MNEDQLNDSLETLFSDLSIPEPEAADEEDTGHERGRRQRPGEREAASARKSELRSLIEKGAAESRDPASTEVEPEGQITGVGGGVSESSGTGGPSAARRPELLQVTLHGVLGVALFVTVRGGYRAFADGRLLLLPLYLIALLTLLSAAFWRRIPYGVRATSLLGSTFGLGLIDLIQFGPDGSGLILLLALPLLAAVPSGKLVSLLVLLASSVAHALFRWAISGARVVPLAQAKWWTDATAFLLLGAGLVIVQNHLIPHLSETLDRVGELRVALANRRARLETQERELKTQARQLELVAEVGQLVASRLPVDRVLSRTAELIPDYIDCYLVAIFLLEESGERLALRVANGKLGRQLESSELHVDIGETSIVGWTAKHGKAYVAPEVSADDVYRPHPGLGGTMSEAAVPLKADGFLVGVLDVQAGSRGAFGEGEVRVLQCVADQLAVAIQNARRTANGALHLEATSPFYRLNRRLSGATTVDQVVGVILDSVVETEADGCLVATFERSLAGQVDILRILGIRQQRKRSWCVEAPGQNRQYELQPGAELPLCESPLPRELMEQFWAVADKTHDSRLSADVRAMLEGIDANACVNVPLQIDGRPVGHVLALSKKPGAFSRPSMQLLRLLGDQAAVALVRAWELEEAQRRARREELGARAAARMHESLDLETVLGTAAQDIGEALGLTALSVRLRPEPAPVGGGRAAGSSGDRRCAERQRGEED